MRSQESKARTPNPFTTLCLINSNSISCLLALNPQISKLLSGQLKHKISSVNFIAVNDNKNLSVFGQEASEQGQSRIHHTKPLVVAGQVLGLCLQWPILRDQTIRRENRCRALKSAYLKTSLSTLSSSGAGRPRPSRLLVRR